VVEGGQQPGHRQLEHSRGRGKGRATSILEGEEDAACVVDHAASIATLPDVHCLYLYTDVHCLYLYIDVHCLRSGPCSVYSHAMQIDACR
jgi:hypothetical protein